MTPKLTRPHLLRPREEVRELLRKQIADANNVMPRLIRSAAELEEAERREKEWRDYNYEFLSRNFSKYEYANEYDNAKCPVHMVEDRYHDPDFAVFRKRLARSIEAQIACLDSIIKRLDLIPENDPAAAVTTVAEGQEALVRLAERLHLIVRQLLHRHNNRPTLDVNDEYDVQDLVHALLKIFFHDIRP
jgi:REase_DpnII-MboI